MASNTGTKRFQTPLPSSSAPPPPPPKINVQKFSESRAAELESLHTIVASRLNGDFRSKRCKRRRTTAFDSKATRRRRKRQRNDIWSKKNDDDKENGDVRVPRRVRRRAQLRMNPERGFSTAGDGTKRLRTHVWHAKRFTMTKLWGYYLPLGLHGRGRGSRALLKWFRDGVLIHDATYHVAVQLEGPEESLLSILRMVLEPSPSAGSAGVSDSVISGAVYENAMLHHIGTPFTKPIAPVMYMWRPCCLRNKDNDVVDVDDQGFKKEETTESHSCFRQLWVWTHASAFSEGYDALNVACQKEMAERGASVKCFSLEGQLAKLEIMGSKAFKLLQKTLSITRILDDSWQRQNRSVAEVDDDSPPMKSSVLDNEDDIASKAVLSLSVIDPRAPRKTKTTANIQESTSSDIIGDVTATKIREHADVVEILDRNEGDDNTFSCRSLWDACSGVISPLEESVLCQERNELHKNFFCLNDPNPAKVQSLRCCPIFLLKDGDKKGLTAGLSIILPLSWVKAFWVPLVSKGAHAIGLREKHWVAAEVGLPFFPSDFPDCNAYTCLKATEAAECHVKEELRPPAIRPFKIPIPPPWDSVGVTLNRFLSRVEDPKGCTEQKQDDGNLIADSENSCCDDLLLVGHDTSLDGFVARTSSSLTNFLHAMKGNHLLLFPQIAKRNTCFSKLVKDESKLGQGQNGTSNIVYNSKLCFLRVLLHSYKEGSFEEGAVVCAPQLTDIKLWASSPENIEGGLQIPQSAVTSYFKEQSSGKWELQIPEDNTTRESHRLPIGFVTTGFVIGSKKPVAVAFCEAVLLARLREEQWSDLPAKRRRKDIYVLVRNLRSTAYRLALATIVLEQQEADVESL